VLLLPHVFLQNSLVLEDLGTKQALQAARTHEIKPFKITVFLQIL
jgi:hypothetical protein